MINAERIIPQLQNELEPWSLFNFHNLWIENSISFFLYRIPISNLVSTYNNPKISFPLIFVIERIFSQTHQIKRMYLHNWMISFPCKSYRLSALLRYWDFLLWLGKAAGRWTNFLRWIFLHLNLYFVVFILTFRSYTEVLMVWWGSGHLHMWQQYSTDDLT